MTQTLKLIKKIDEVTALNGMVVDSLSSNSSSDAPSIRAVNESVAKKNDVLSLEEIKASTDLNGKIASASALLDMAKNYYLNDSLSLIHI